MTTTLWMGLGFALPAFGAPLTTIDFEDVGGGLAPESAYVGADGAGGFASGNGEFANQFTDFGGGCCWNGWSYSNKTDNTTPGFTNDTSAFPGMGSGGSASYGVAFTLGNTSITFDNEIEVVSGDFTNTTFAALAMRDGSPPFSRQFGSPGGDAPDFLRLDVVGFDKDGITTGTVELFLADYRFTDNTEDFILDTWVTLDLEVLGPVKRLEFFLDGSDVGQFGLNTPAYFALDNLVTTPIPEPSAALLFGLGLVTVAARKRS